MSGTVTSRRTARMRPVSKPARVPSASIEFSSTSPTPSSAAWTTHSTAGQRDEDALRGAPDDVVGGLPVAGAGGDIEEGELVGALRVVDPGHLHRVPGVDEVHEVDALDDPAGVDVQTGDDPDRQAH